MLSLKCGKKTKDLNSSCHLLQDLLLQIGGNKKKMVKGNLGKSGDRRILLDLSSFIFTTIYINCYKQPNLDG